MLELLAPLHLAVLAPHMLQLRTDGGPQFVAYRVTTRVTDHGLWQTVTPKRSPRCNPFAEAFFGR